MSVSSLPSAAAGRLSTPRYDRVMIALHWLTALLVISLFASALVWDELERGTPLRKGLQSLHISMGLTLTVILVARIAWRLNHRRQLPPPVEGLQGRVAGLAHLALYLLLTAQICLGFLFRWAQNEPFAFFGLFSIPRVLDLDPDLRHTFGELHENVAWAIIILAGLHAAAALYHHYIAKDTVLARMLPHGRG